MKTETTSDRPLPTTIPDYLAQLRAALVGADPAMIQDALYDAEEYLRSELAEQVGKSEAEVIAGVAGSYGAPEEVAEIYRETEITVNRALRTPSAAMVPTRRAAAVDANTTTPPPTAAVASRSLLARFFGVALEVRTYGALLYMLLSLATGIFFFTWVVTGLSLGLLVLIIGVPIMVLFFGSVRGLSLLEGRLVEVLLGERMPRRPTYSDRSRSWMQRIGDMFTDSRTWLTLLYFVLMLPLGIGYFTIATTLLSASLALLAAPLVSLFGSDQVGIWINGTDYASTLWASPVLMIAGLLLLIATLHVARGIGKLHGMMAKHLLVRL